MQNQRNVKVKINNNMLDRNRFDFDHDVNTTTGLGTIEPLVVRQMHPHDKAVLSVDTLVRTTPLVVPAWMKAMCRTWTSFIPMSSVYPNWDYFKTQTAKKSSQGMFVPTTLPRMSLSQHSVLPLIGATMSIWMLDETDDKWRKPNLNSSGDPHGLKDIYAKAISRLNGRIKVMNMSGTAFHVNADALAFDVAGLWSLPMFNGSAVSSSKTLWFPLGNKVSVGDPWYNHADISPSNADAVFVTSKVSGGDGSLNHVYAFCWRYSNLGKLIAKFYRGFRYRLDLCATDPTDEASILPLLAWYRAYFKFFGIERERSWEATDCHALIHQIEEYNKSEFGFGVTDTDFFNKDSNFWKFIVNDFLASFYPTDEYDLISSQRPTLTEPDVMDGTVPPSFGTGRIAMWTQIANKAINSMTGMQSDIKLSSMISDNSPLSLADHIIDYRDWSTLGIKPGWRDTGSSLANTINQQVLDALKALARCTNKNDVLGQNVRTLLNAFGYDEYVEDSVAEFVGFREFPLEVQEVTSVADTTAAAGDSGRPLGEQGATSISSSLHDRNRGYADKLVYSADEEGYFICMFGICPTAGYINTCDEHHFMTSRYDQYEKEFEAKGYEATRKERLFGSGGSVAYAVEDRVRNHLFGFLPRFSLLKFMSNLYNGDFVRGSKRDAMLPYTSDKVIYLNDVNGSASVTTDNFVECDFNPQQYNATTVPIAGEIWKYLYRLGFIGNLNRMFVNYDKEMSRSEMLKAVAGLVPLTYNQDDNFIVHNRCSFTLESEMLPVSETYMTFDDEAKANKTTAIS